MISAISYPAFQIHELYYPGLVSKLRDSERRQRSCWFIAAFVSPCSFRTAVHGGKAFFGLAT